MRTHEWQVASEVTHLESAFAIATLAGATGLQFPNLRSGGVYHHRSNNQGLYFGRLEVSQPDHRRAFFSDFRPHHYDVPFGYMRIIAWGRGAFLVWAAILGDYKRVRAIFFESGHLPHVADCHEADLRYVCTSSSAGGISAYGLPSFRCYIPIICWPAAE